MKGTITVYLLQSGSHGQPGLNGCDFTERMQLALAMAHEQAARHHSEHVLPEHMLLALLAQNQSACTRLLDGFGVRRDILSQELEEIVKRPEPESANYVNHSYGPAGLRVLQRALSEAERLGHTFVGTEHLLLGIVEDPTIDAAPLLAKYELTSDRLLPEIERQVAAMPASPRRSDAFRAQFDSRVAAAKRTRRRKFLFALALGIAAAALALVLVRHH